METKNMVIQENDLQDSIYVRLYWGFLFLEMIDISGRSMWRFQSPSRAPGMLKASVIHADETGDAGNAIFHGAAKKVNADAWLLGAGMVDGFRWV